MADASDASGRYSEVSSQYGATHEAEKRGITDITVEVLDTYMDPKKWRLRAHKHITFHSSAFHLESLDGLLRQPINLASLESLDVSNNALEDLKCVEGKSRQLEDESCIQGYFRFQALQVLKARRNLLSDFVCVLPTLRELDMSWNCLKMMPPTAGLPSLEVLVLSHNKMQGSWSNLKHLGKLKRLDLSYNCYNFKPTELGAAMDTVVGCSHLTSLRIKENLFAKTTSRGGCFPEYQTYVIKRMRHLSELDDLDKAAFGQALKIADALPDFDLDQYDVMVYNRQKVLAQVSMSQSTQQSKPDSAQVPTWLELTSAIDEGLMDPEMLPKTVKHVARICGQVSECDPQKVGEIWRDPTSRKDASAEGASMTDVETKIRGFLDNFMILLGRVEENEAWRIMLIRSLAKLSTVHTPVYGSHSGEKGQRSSLGVKCIETFGFLMKRSEDMEEEIMSVLQEIVIEPLSARSRQADVPINTVQALCQLESEKLPRALLPIVSWLARMYCEGNGHPQPDLAHLLAVATSNRDNARELLDAGKDGLPRHVMMSLENKKLYQAEDCRDQYISHITILQNTATVSSKVGEVFLEKHIHKDLMRNFKYFFGDDIDGPENARQKGHNLNAKRQLNLRTCGHILSALSALMAFSSREVLLDLVDSASESGGILGFVAIAPKASPVADPMLLSASLQCMLTILKRYPRDNVSARQMVTLQIVKDLEKMIPMMEIIDCNAMKYRELCAAAERHVVEKENRKQVVSTQAPRFGNLHNPLVSRCFQSIVELIEFFTAEAKRDQICAEVSSVMNGHDREILLFKLLEVPCDDLQDAVMKCFQQVDMADMSADEVHYLIKILDNVKDVATEADVLEHIIRQMCLFAGDNSSSSGPAIGKDNAEFAINSVMGVLLRNARRDTFGRVSEEGVKHRLSRACISFLQTASTLLDLRNPHMRSKYMKEVVPEVMKLEDDLCNGTTPDVVLECTWAGGDIETLLACFFGPNQLKSRGKVAFRVLSRIADVLEGNREMQAELTAQSRTLQGVCDRERPMWDEERMKSDLRYLSDIERDDRNMQQRIFGQYAGLGRVVNFLEGLFADEGTRKRALMEETTAVTSAQHFVDAARATASACWEESQRAGGSGVADLQTWRPAAAGELADRGEDSDSDSGGGGSEVEAAALEWSGGCFDGEGEGVVDLGSPPYSYEGELGGAMSIFFVARWDALNPRSRILDFGSGCPKDNIIIGNQAQYGNLVFEFFTGTSEIPCRMVALDCITVGSTNKYLCTISANGHMKVFVNGTLIGERSVGCTPKLLPRNNLYLGRSQWSSSALFKGQIFELKVWQAKALEWDDVMKDDNEEEEGDVDVSEVDRTLLMKVFLGLDAPLEELPQKQELLGGLSASAPTQRQDINEQIFDDEREALINKAYPVSALLRICYAMLKVPANEKSRKDMAQMICSQLVVTRLQTMVGLVGVFSLRVAAKFLRLISCALELPPSETTAKPDIVVVAAIMASYYGKICHAATGAVWQEEDQELRKRGAELCREIARMASVACRSMPLCSISDVKPLQSLFVELCLERLVPISVVKSILKMLINDSKPAQDGSEGMGEEMWELSRLVLSQMLDGCKKMKYPILRAFSENLVSSHVSLRPSFLSALLAESRQGYEKTQVENYLNSELRSEKLAGGRGGGVERVVMSVKVHVVVSGTPLVVHDARHSEACFVCMVTNKGLYVIDATASSYPERPSIVQQKGLDDMTRLVKGEASQVLSIGWIASGWGEYDASLLNEQFMTLICHSEVQREELFSTLHVLSEPPGGQFRHRVLIQSDSVFRAAIENTLAESASLMAFVLAEARLELFILSDGHVYQCAVHFGRWQPPYEDDTEEQAQQDDSPSGADASAQANKPGGGTGSEADAIAARRLKARMRFESSLPGGVERQSKLITLSHPPRPLAQLDKVAFYPDKQPRMALFFETETVEVVFLDDTTRERWRKCLMAQLGRLGEGSSWSRSYEGQPALTQ